VRARLAGLKRIAYGSRSSLGFGYPEEVDQGEEGGAVRHGCWGVWVGAKVVRGEEMKKEPGPPRAVCEPSEGRNGPPVRVLDWGGLPADGVSECESGQKRTSGGRPLDVEDIAVDDSGD